MRNTASLMRCQPPSRGRRLVALLDPIECKVNLILFNPHAGARFQPCLPEALQAFRSIAIQVPLPAPAVATHCRFNACILVVQFGLSGAVFEGSNSNLLPHRLLWKQLVKLLAVRSGC